MKHLLCLLVPLVAGCSTVPVPQDPATVQQDVWDRELAFAATLEALDPEAFAAFLSEDAIFLTEAGPLRGKAAVVEGWAPFFVGPVAPFAWEPDQVEVLASGDLALSTGPVHGPDGAVLGRFTSIWRLEPEGWRIVLDKGE